MHKNTVLRHRPYAFGMAKDWIANRNTWHLDLYLYVQPDSGQLYLHALTLAGGTELIGEQWFALVEGSAPMPVSADLLPALNELYLSVATVRAYPWLTDYHTAHLSRLADLWPRALYKRRSVLFHYITPHMVNEPTEGLLNYYSMTGREQRDLEHRQRMAGST